MGMLEEARLWLITGVANAGVCVSIFLVALDQKDSVWNVQGNGIRNIFQCGITTTAVNIAEESELQVTEKAVAQFKRAYLTDDASVSFLLGVENRFAAKFG